MPKSMMVLALTLFISVFMFGGWYEPTSASAADKVIFVTSGTTWTVPTDWNSAANTIEVIGGGGGGDSANGTGSGGGGGGAYAKITNLTLTPSGSVTIAVGTGGAQDIDGTATWFNGANCAGSSVCGDLGVAGLNLTGGAGGLTANSVGTLLYAGGTGGSGNGTSDTGGGGGGAAGPGGAGKNGGAGSTSTASGGGGGAGGALSTAGGNAVTTTGGNGGTGPTGIAGPTGTTGAGSNATAGSGAGGSGAGGTTVTPGGTGAQYNFWTQTSPVLTAGPGGGGGGAGNSGIAGAGGGYGAGGGGGEGTGGSGTPGIIVITYTPVAADTLSVAGNTPGATAASPGSTNLQMQMLQVASDNSGNSNVVINSITVNDLGTATTGHIDFMKVHIDSDNNFGNGVLDTISTATWAGTSTVVDLSPMAAATRTVTFGTAKYIWITYDLNAAIPVSTTVQSSVTAIAVVAPDGSATGTWNSNNLSVTSGPISTLADCGSCHNYPPVDTGTRNATTGDFIGDHDKHVLNTCATCHITPATETATDFAHRTGKLSMDNGNIGVGTDTGTYSKGTEFNQINNPVGGTCSLVDCHNNAITPQWGVGTTACNSCHTLPPATNAHAAHYTAKGWAADNTNCTVCHPDNTTGHSDVTDNSVTVNASLTPGGVSPAITCTATPATGCHNSKTTPAWNTTNIACTSCHTAGGAAAGDPTTGLHATTNLTDHDGTLAGGTGLACEKCHTASPSSLHFNGTVNTAATATYAWATNIPAGYDRTNDYCAATCHTDSGTWNREWSGVTDAAWAYANDAATTAVCGNCHGSFFTGWNIVGNTTHDNPDIDNDPDTLATSKASHSECSTCHAWGHTNYSTGVKHENNTLEMNSTLDTTPGDGSCTTTCHSPLTLTMNATSGWTDASVAGAGVVCGGCHTGGVTTATASGAHDIHGATAASVAANPASIALCISCHGNDGTGVTHNNGSVNFASVTYSTAVRNVVTGTCLTANCHNVNTKALQSTAWNSSALDCNSCHFYPTTTPAVTVTTSAANTAAGRPLSTTHGAHFDGGKTCNQCHGTMPVAGDTSHITTRTSLTDMAVAVLADNADVSAMTDYTFENTGNTCGTATNNGLGCHATGTPDWDVAFASTACTNCHTETTNTLVNPTSGLHGVTPSITAEKHDDSFDGATASCASCHTSIPVAGTHKDGVFAGGAGQTSTMGLAAFYTQTANDTGTCATTTCHLGGAAGSDAWAHKWMATANYTNATASCTGCHGNLASGWNAGVSHLTGEIATDHADDATASNYGCEACHAMQASTAVYPFTFGTADWLPLNAGNKHGNSLITMNDDGTATTGTISNWQRGTLANSTKSMCLKCHTDWTTTGAAQRWFTNTDWTAESIIGDGISAGHGVGAACVSCHDGSTQGTRRDVGLEFNLTMQHGTNAPTSADCEKCHDESTGPDSIVQLKVWDAAGTGFTPATYSSTDLSSANTHCVSCHDTTRNVTVGGLSAPARSMANYTSVTTYNNHNFNGTTYNTAIVPQMAKAISPHGNPNGNQLKGTESTVTTAMGCLHCHPSHGSATASKAATADAVGVAVAARMLGGLPSSLASVGYDYTSEGALSDPALCWGCHDNKGVADYYGDTTTGHWNGGTWKSPSFSYKTGKGGVAVLHIADKVDGGVASDTAASIVCTTCHDVHGSPTVAQFYSPALKGKWLTSPYYEDRASQSYAATTYLFLWPNAGAFPRGGNTGYSPRAEPSNAATTWVPKEIGGGYGTVGTQNGAWGYFIDANTFGMSSWATESAGALPTQQYFYNRDSANFTSSSMTNFAGLCMTACHSQANIDTRTSNWSGHKATVPGFGGTTTARDLFNITPAATQLTSGRDQVGKHYYNDAGYGQNLFAQTARQGGDSGAMDGKAYSHNKSVSWGVTVASATATTQTNYHQFTCSKCHTPHATELPALMRTNCLDVSHSTYEYRMADEAANCHRVEQATPTLGVDAMGGADQYTGAGAPNGQKWNAVTPW